MSRSVCRANRTCIFIYSRSKVGRRITDGSKQIRISSACRRAIAAGVREGSLEVQREVVDAFFAAARRGDFEALISVLDPDVVLRSDGGAERALTARVEGAAAVAGRALMFANPAAKLHPVVVNGGAGVVVTVDGRPFSLIALNVVGGRIAEIEAIADHERLS